MKKPPTTTKPGAPPDPLRRAKRAMTNLRQRLRDAEATLDAIRTGQVDALVVQGPLGDQIFTLKGADRRYRQLVETMNEGALLVSGDGTIVYCNLRFATLVKMPLEKVMGSPVRPFVPDIWQRTLDALLRGREGAATHAEAEVLSSDGGRVRVYLSVAESWDAESGDAESGDAESGNVESGNTEGGNTEEKLTCVIVTDLGEQKRSQEAVAAERLAALIVEQAAEGVVVCDIQGRIVRASRAAELVAGDNPLLRRFEDVFHLTGDGGAPIAGDMIRSALAGKMLSGVEAAIRHDAPPDGGDDAGNGDGDNDNAGPDAESHVLLLSAGPILSGDGESLGAVVSFVDITDRKRAAEERALLLERANAARAEAEAANRAKDEFLAMLGHELRNPLAPILTALQVMRMKKGEASERERAVIERQVKHVVTLVDDLLDVSRITRGRVELDRHLVELRQVLAHALELAGPMIEDRDHQLHVEMEPGLWVDADETRLAQVLVNLLTNAAKYTERGGHIWFRAFRRGDEIVAIVRDSGTGLPPDIIPNVFDMFVQGKRTIDRSEGGLGLGLAIVRSLMSLHGGKVAARSDGVGKGSEFELSLPAAPSPSVTASAAPVSLPTVDKPAEGAPAARKILVVDDNVDAADLLADALTDYGHETRVAYDGPSALAVAARFNPDVALLDIGLPVMDGFELARRLKSEVLPASMLRLIALTGYGQSSDRQRSAAAGFDRHFVKPVRLEELNLVIQQLTA